MVGSQFLGAQRVARLPRSNRMRVVLALVVLTLVSTIVTAATYASFTAGSSTGNASFSTGTLSLTNDRSGTALLSIGANKMLPGDTVSGYVQVTNSGTEDVVGYQLQVALAGGATANNLTDSTKTGSLRMYVQRCSAAWTAGVCGGATTNVVGTPAAPVTVIGNSNLNVTPGNAFCSTNAGTAAERSARGVTCDATILGATDYLKVVVNLPGSADNTYQGLSTTLGFTFAGGQGGSVNY